MQVCGSCFQVYQDGHFISSGGGLCDYCFSIMGLGHNSDVGTINIDLNWKGRGAGDEWVNQRTDFRIFRC